MNYCLTTGANLLKKALQISQYKKDVDEYGQWKIKKQDRKQPV